ncbi:unnamed protein product [Pelagomonas calceolata]|uniref:Uncharacterized protein n=2 Tax=Pelagomonas calceolata TaxID=35677 RepID=A0A8J2WZ43_9STRA|nr:unnamed protein product [Pelagomonas calceolata]
MDATKKQKKKKRKRPHQKHAGAASLAKRYPFATDFCDHFETPRQAYADVAPALDALVAKSRAETRIYDPYYCDGAVKRHLRELGFTNAKNDNLDFYASKAYRDPANTTHDVVVTNPPFSEDHKERCLRWALATRKPFALLLPAYVVERRWFREAFGDEARPFFVAPRERYGFDHPLGAGADASPFFSVWVVDSGRGAAATASIGSTLSDNVFADVDALRRAGHVRAEAKRPNPKRRRKQLARRAGGVE